MYCHVLPYCLLDHLLQAGTDVILSKWTRRFKCQAMSSKQVTNVTSHGHGGHASSKPPHHNISQYTDQITSQHVTTCYCIRTVTLWISFSSVFDQSLISLWSVFDLLSSSMFILVHLAPRCAVRQNLRAVSSRLKAQRPQAWPLWNLEHIGKKAFDMKNGILINYWNWKHIMKTILINIEMGWVRTSQCDAGGLQFEDIWGYEWIAASLTHYPRLESSNQPEFHQKKPQSRSARWVPRWCPKTSQDDPRCPTGLFFQGCLLALFYSRNIVVRVVDGKWPSGSHVCHTMSHLSSAGTLWRIGHIQLTCIKSSPLNVLARPQRHPQKHKHVWNVLKCLEMLSGSEPPQSSKAPTRGDRLRSDIVQSEMSVPQILHVEWKFKATCTTQAMLLAPWKLLIACGFFAWVIQSIFEASSLCFSSYLVSPVFTLF